MIFLYCAVFEHMAILDMWQYILMSLVALAAASGKIDTDTEMEWAYDVTVEVLKWSTTASGLKCCLFVEAQFSRFYTFSALGFMTLKLALAHLIKKAKQL